MLIFRSALFNTVHYLNLIVFMLLLSPFFLLPRKAAMWAMRSWAKSADFLHRLIVGVKVEVRGRENLVHGPCIVASKHQSLWETYGLLMLLDDPAIIYKQELGWIPFFGWWAVKFKMVAVKRGGRIILQVESLQVLPGELIGIIGTNGAGKTTLLRLCCGLVRPSRGRVELAGFDLAKIPAWRKSILRKQIGYVSQAFEYHPE